MPKTLKVRLDLRDDADFKLDVPTRRKSVVTGTDATYTVSSEALTGYDDDVDLSVTGLPTGASATIGTDPIGGAGSTTVTVETVGVAAGSYEFTVGGTVYTPSVGTITADSCSNADIQAAIDAAGDGYTVNVPAGAVTWTGNVTIPSTKGIKLIGAGIGETNINQGGVYGLSAITRSTNSPIRISGFSFTNCSSAADGASLVIGDYTIGATDWRVDNCSWGGTTVQAPKIGVRGYTFGVFDNCTFTDMRRCVWLDMRLSSETQDPASATIRGSYSWTQPITYQGRHGGGPAAVYFEDCTINQTTWEIFHNMRSGCRVVYRHCTFNGIPTLETHSGCTNGFRNNRWIEVYDNTWNDCGAWCIIQIRSINGMIYNNTIDATSMSEWLPIDCETLCRSATCKGMWPTSNQTAYPGQDQIGAGIDTGSRTAQSTTEAKLFMWNNIGNGQDRWHVNSCAAWTGMIESDRDYFLPNTNFAADPSTGIGYGLLAARPNTGLTADRFYWATDTNTLYRATDPTTWETYYTPYTYPHPVTLL